MNKRLFAGVATAVVAALTMTACGGSSDPTANEPAQQPTGSGGPVAKPDKIIVGSANFPENVVLAEIYAAALAKKGITIEKKLNIGNRETYYPGLQDGSIDLMPEYTGVLLQHVNKSATETGPDDVYAALQKALPPNLTVLEKSSAEDKDAIVVTKETADRWSLKSIEDLKAHAGEVIFGGPPEIANRPDGLPGFKKNYDLEFKEFRPLDTGGPLTVNALKTNVVQAADLFTTDPAITVNNFVVLDDPKNNFAAQNVVPLINSAKASDEVKQVLNAISAKLTTEILIDLNAKLSAPDKPDASKVAADWLASAGIS
ncbi:MAG TPA: ABC transporter substrate-binding protein [Actinophytocola sp.]|uniref:ABC transporter substrate-binding protein n=1 Tax=Actinophytocola sp. TaxID=1872138 RepID=UPI002DBF4CD0|nr:ABC transporter substrate-binding protein [Actinophytocola sp.]HEU5473757.1 ABC transporter substrate-binding protein [Actinophytocola sp.]